MTQRTYIVTIDVDQQNVAMPARAVRLGVEERLLGDGFTGQVTVTLAGPFCPCTWFDENEDAVGDACHCGHLRVLHGPAGCRALTNSAPYPPEVGR